MKKIIWIIKKNKMFKITSYLFILLFIFSCSNSDDLVDNIGNNIENITLEENDILFDSWYVDLIDDTTEDDIDELIDILFDTNTN